MLGHSRPPLRIVDDGSYMAKIMGCDPHSVFGGDTEFSSMIQKDSFIPFDLLREDTAENNDLWVEYALAMKGERNFYFSRSLTRNMTEYYEAHPDKRPVSAQKTIPESSVVAQVGFPVYKLFYYVGCLKEFFARAAEGYDALVAWCHEKYRELNLSALVTDKRFLPFKPVDSSLLDSQKWQDILRSLVDEERQQNLDLFRCWEESMSRLDVVDEAEAVSTGEDLVSQLIKTIDAREEERKRARSEFWRERIRQLYEPLDTS